MENAMSHPQPCEIIPDMWMLEAIDETSPTLLSSDSGQDAPYESDRLLAHSVPTTPQYRFSTTADQIGRASNDPEATGFRGQELPPASSEFTKPTKCGCVLRLLDSIRALRVHNSTGNTTHSQNGGRENHIIAALRSANLVIAGLVMCEQQHNLADFMLLLALLQLMDRNLALPPTIEPSEVDSMCADTHLFEYIEQQPHRDLTTVGLTSLKLISMLPLSLGYLEVDDAELSLHGLLVSQVEHFKSQFGARLKPRRHWRSTPTARDELTRSG
ncbi:hypothetical protein HJFPF1_10586 [Paramyrothecium foliicola]|nr:hypothetical protein HJFPF1_10586 [Paramyrothecium foliicola]